MRSMRWLLSMGLGLGLVGTVGAQMRQGVAQAELTGSVMGKVACDDANVPARFARVTLDPVPLAADATKAQATGLGAGLGADVGSGVISGSAGVTVTTVTTTVETALDGSFSMPKVKAGEYYVNIEKEGYITAKSMFTAKEMANPTPEVKAILDKVLHRIKVEVGQTTQVEVRLERGAAVGGTVLYDDGSPAGEMQLKLLHKDTTGKWVPVSNYGRKYGAGISTDDRGRYRVASLLADEYMLEADMSLNDITAKSSGTEGRRMNFVMSNSRSSLSFYGPGAVTMAEATSFTLRAGQERTGEDLTIPLAKLHKLTGRVAAGRDSHSVNAASLSLVTKGDAKPIATATVSREDGLFHFDFVPEGDYVLQVKNARDVVWEHVEEKNDGPQLPAPDKERVVESFGGTEVPMMLRGDSLGMTVTVPAKAAGASTAQ